MNGITPQSCIEGLNPGAEKDFLSLLSHAMFSLRP